MNRGLFLASMVLGVASDLAGAQASAPLEEIVVTSRRVAENLQDVPVAITAFTTKDLEKAAIRNVRDLANFTPNMTFTSSESGRTAVPVIRGIGLIDGRGFDNAVGVFIDGLFVSGRAAQNVGMLDLERVEVVKGPQSALYGRNTFAGAINYVTMPLTEAVSARAEATLGSDDLRRFSGSLAGPVNDWFAARLAVSWEDDKGTYRNSGPLGVGDGIGGGEAKSALLTLQFKPTDDLAITATGSWNDEFGDNRPAARPAEQLRPARPDGRRQHLAGQQRPAHAALFLRRGPPARGRAAVDVARGLLVRRRVEARHAGARVVAAGVQAQLAQRLHHLEEPGPARHRPDPGGRAQLRLPAARRVRRRGLADVQPRHRHGLHLFGLRPRGPVLGESRGQRRALQPGDPGTLQHLLRRKRPRPGLLVLGAAHPERRREPAALARRPVLLPQQERRHHPGRHRRERGRAPAEPAAVADPVRVARRGRHHSRARTPRLCRELPAAAVPAAVAVPRRPGHRPGDLHAAHRRTEIGVRLARVRLHREAHRHGRAALHEGVAGPQQRLRQLLRRPRPLHRRVELHRPAPDAALPAERGPHGLCLGRARHALRRHQRADHRPRVHHLRPRDQQHLRARRQGDARRRSRAARRLGVQHRLEGCAVPPDRARQHHDRHAGHGDAERRPHQEQGRRGRDRGAAERQLGDGRRGRLLRPEVRLQYVRRHARAAVSPDADRCRDHGRADPGPLRHPHHRQLEPHPARDKRQTAAAHVEGDGQRRRRILARGARRRAARHPPRRQLPLQAVQRLHQRQLGAGADHRQPARRLERERYDVVLWIENLADEDAPEQVAQNASTALAGSILFSTVSILPVQRRYGITARYRF